MYLGRFKQGEWLTLTFPKFHIGSGAREDHLEDFQFPTPDVPDWSTVGDDFDSYSDYVTGTEEPTVAVLDNTGTIVIDAKAMHLWEIQLDPSLYKVSIFIGSDVPVGQCVARTEYTSRWARQYKGEWYLNPRIVQHHSLSYPFEVLPCGDGRGTYISSYFYERPHASFLLGQYDGGRLDFRKNPRE